MNECLKPCSYTSSYTHQKMGLKQMENTIKMRNSQLSSPINSLYDQPTPTGWKRAKRVGFAV